MSMPAKNRTAGRKQTVQNQRKSMETTNHIKKTVLHNVEVPITNNRVTFHSNKNTGSVKSEQNHQGACSMTAKKYHVPELNTALKISKEIKNIETGKRNTEVGKQVMKQILEETDSLRKEQLTKQLNFPKPKKIYTGLVPININDSVIQMDAKRIVPRKPKYSNTTKDPEPNLADFVEPVAVFEFDDLRTSIKFTPENFRPPDLSYMSEQIQDLHEMTQLDY